MTAQQQAPADRRDCALYRFWVRHPRTGKRVLGYVGETARMPFQRLMEHVYDKPWADTILGWEVDPRVYVGKPAVLAAEETAIRQERPLYNVEHNMDNPHRVPPWDQVTQRQRREPGWQPVTRPARVPRQRRAAASAGGGWQWTPERVAALLFAVCGLIVWAVVGWQVAALPVATWVDGLAYGGGVASVTVGLVLPGERCRRRRR